MAVTDRRAQDKALSDVVLALGGPNFPEAVSRFVRSIMAFDNLIVIAYVRDLNPEVLYRESVVPQVYQNMDTYYLNAAYLLDPFYQAHRQGLKTGIHRLFDLAPDQFRRTSYFRKYYESTTLVDEVAVFADPGPEITLTACFGKDCSSNQPFNRSELKQLRNYEYTLCALLRQHWQNYQPRSRATLPPLTDRLRQRLGETHNIHLSPRQAQVALMILQGHSSLSVSLNLNISVETVKVFRKQLYAKCGLSSQAQLFALLIPVISEIS